MKDIDFDGPTKVKILLSLQDHAVTQLAEIKKNEISWLRTFLIFYSAVIAWGTIRWLSSGYGPGSPMSSAAERSVIFSTAGLSFFTTCVFAYHYLHSRWSYYRVARRLIEQERLLKLHDATTWGDKPPVGPHNPFTRLDSMKTIKDWAFATKPTSSFGSQVIYGVGANFIVDYVCWMALRLNGHSASGGLLVRFLLANIVLIGVVYAVDLRHFLCIKKKG